MLHRPPSRRRQRDTKRERRRLARRVAQREYRRRFDDGLIVVGVEIDGDDGDVVEMLIATDWLKAVERKDRKKIGAAIAAMVADAAAKR